MTEELQTMAADLLEILWRGVPADYKSKYRMTIWTQFENQVRSAAYTSNLGKFVNSLCSKLQINLGYSDAERARAEAILNSNRDRALLRLLREETTLLVLMVRVRRDAAGERLTEKPDVLDDLEAAGRRFRFDFGNQEDSE